MDISPQLIQCIKNLQKISITADEKNENETKCINNNMIQIIQKNYKIRINKSSIFLLAVLMTNTCTGLFVMQLRQNILSDCFPVVLWISRIALKTLPAIVKA